MVIARPPRTHPCIYCSVPLSLSPHPRCKTKYLSLRSCRKLWGFLRKRIIELRFCLHLPNNRLSPTQSSPTHDAKEMSFVKTLPQQYSCFGYYRASIRLRTRLHMSTGILFSPCICDTKQKQYLHNLTPVGLPQYNVLSFLGHAPKSHR